jgi:catalase
MYSQQIFPLLSLVGIALALCPYMDEGSMQRRDSSTETFLSQFELDDSNSVMTSDVGGPIGDQFSLKGGDRGPTLLEDFIFRQKIQHFDHERVRSTSVVLSLYTWTGIKV